MARKEDTLPPVRCTFRMRAELEALAEKEEVSLTAYIHDRLKWHLTNNKRKLSESIKAKSENS